jgi:hypothetical protein
MNRVYAAGAVALMIGMTAGAQAPDPALYAGVKSCGMCHKSEASGNQLGLWQESKHAKAFEVLGTPEAKEVGKKLGIDNPQASPKCLTCHATAYNFGEAAVVEKITPEEGVTCESCHGPGKNYKAKEVMKDRAQCIANGMVYPATKSCEKCHNEKSPTFKPGFKAETAYEKIKHPNPKVKHD